MSACTSEILPQRHYSRALDGSYAWVGALLFAGSSVVSVKAIAWLGTFAMRHIIQ